MYTVFNEFRTNKNAQSFTSNHPKTRIERAKITNQDDRFESSQPSINKSNNGKFDISEAAVNLVKGITSPITAMINHPIATVGIVLGTAAATTLVPVLGPALAIGFGVASLYQVGKGTYDAVKNYKDGNYDDAEKSFDKIGQGIVGTVMSALGMKQSAKIAREAELMSKNNTTTLTYTQKRDIAMQVKENGFFSAVKDNVKLLTTKNGLKSIAHQFKPSSIKTRFTEIIDQYGIRKFEKTPEGIRRASLTDEQIEQEVNALYNESFEKLGIPEEQRPILKIENGAKKHGGGYRKHLHQLEFNPEAYKAGSFEIEDVIMHEATHCKEALLRAGIPQDRANQLVKEQLISRVMNGESEKVLVKGNLFGADMMTPPKMSAQMKQDFIQFAENNLYDNKINSDLVYYSDLAKNPMSKLSELSSAKQKVQPILDKLDAMLAKNPEFVQQYGSTEKALNALTEYSVSHNVRYNIFTDVGIKKSGIPINIEKLSGEKLVQAEQSLVDNIATIEGNGRMSGLNGFFADSKTFNQYQFSPEEVLAQKNGNNFVIEKFTNKIAEMKANGTLTPQEEARLIKVISNAQKVIEYKTKGIDYYKQYTKMINNPDNAELAQVVQTLEKELNLIKNTPNTATTTIPETAVINLMNLIDNKSKNIA